MSLADELGTTDRTLRRLAEVGTIRSGDARGGLRKALLLEESYLRAHWEVLIRARAIENQAFVVASGQVGRHPPDHESYGHSMIVDPWGTVLARASDEPEHVVTAELDLDAQAEIRAKLPSLANRQPEAYRRPALR